MVKSLFTVCAVWIALDDFFFSKPSPPRELLRVGTGRAAYPPLMKPPPDRFPGGKPGSIYPLIRLLSARRVGPGFPRP
jgi:hypothetical protein